MAQNGTVEKLLGAGAGWARMNAAVVSDLAGALNPMGGNGHGPDDWLDAWDPQYIRTTLTTGRPTNDNWAWEVSTLAKYDGSGLFFNPFLSTLFTS